MNYKLVVTYKGTNYCGFAKQNDVPTIEGTIRKTFEELFDLQIVMFGSGRTDKYVHALNQVINVRHKNLALEPNALLKALNSKLPNDIYIKSAEIVDDNFHARFFAKQKTYIYKMNIASEFNIFEQDIIYQYNKSINFVKLDEFIQIILGEHNFLSFSTSEIENTTRIIYDFNYSLKNEILTFSITGNGFLRNMVRMIIGCFLNYNENKITIDDIQSYFHHPSKGSVCRKEKGCGLYLLKVEY